MAVYSVGMTDFLDGTEPNLWTNGVDGDFECMLVQSTFAQDQADNFVSAIGADEANATNYARVDLPVATRTLTTGGEQSRYDAADTVFSAIGNGDNDVLIGAIVFRDTGNDTTSILLCYSPFPANVNTNGGDVTVQWSGTGIFALDATP